MCQLPTPSSVMKCSQKMVKVDDESGSLIPEEKASKVPRNISRSSSWENDSSNEFWVRNCDATFASFSQ